MTATARVRKAFISVTHHDCDVARQIVERLRERDTASWVYTESYIGNIRNKIDEEIHSADVFILLVSRAAIESPWVEDELNLAMSLRRRIVPVQIGELPDGSLRGAWRMLHASHNFIKVDPANPQDIQKLIDCLFQETAGATDGSGRSQTSQSGRAEAPVRRESRRPRLRVRWRKYVLLGLLLALLGVGYFYVLPDRVDKSLSSYARVHDFAVAYEQAKSWQKSWLLFDKSIATYWRVIAYQGMTNTAWRQHREPQAIAELEQEYREGLAQIGNGRRASSLIYQYAHVQRAIGDMDGARRLLTRVQDEFPDSPRREGTAFYLCQIALDRGEMLEVDRQIHRLLAMPLDSRIYDFDAETHISVREGIARLQEMIKQKGAGPASMEKKGG